ncbi:MAG: hypothetical protein K0R18_488 [Bacillales bacterium]|jgi:hypothetical protein|nr:hypothetical protein [Bacillales bacterium]
MRNKINFKLGECPICRSKMFDEDKYGYSTCPNKCFWCFIDRYTAFANVKIFDEPILYNVEKLLFDDEDLEEFSMHQIRFMERLIYWRKNDRYLMKIMGVD